MSKKFWDAVYRAKEAALAVLLNNMHGPYRGLPRTAGWGYPEPYTRDSLICGLGILTSENKSLTESLRRVLNTLARNQSHLGHIPSLVHDPEDRGASDTTPLFLLMAGCFRKATKEHEFLEPAVQKALTWMDYQSPADRVMVGQLPTSDWRDEQWVLGFGLYVNTIVHSYLRLHGEHQKADTLRKLMGRFAITADVQHRHVHEGFALRRKPYYAAWSYKIYKDERFDLLGNSLAILSGIASPTRASSLISWIEAECEALRAKDELALDLPPCLFPYIRPGEPDWRDRYERFNHPGKYHNGGVWPFICGFYIAALVAAGKFQLAKKKMAALTELVKPTRKADVSYGFNEWFSAQDGAARGEDWQSWSAAMYLYAAHCLERQETPFFDEVRANTKHTQFEQ